ncbi:F-box-like domain-containing protein [Cephalotus follicularis]|uniref:F-box protein n=1 Tax=Cephalotus follicularis TaxID=3775 RepID=A0A1Q3CRF0_CEPFO|nr:F-box-like domain-containing protein [Cephalotus follicularis]
MERLPADLCLKIFCFLDLQNLATAQNVCRRWKTLASDNNLWSNLFKERWGGDHARFYAPTGSKSWKDVYEVQNRCDRIGLGLKIIKEGGDYYLVHQGEIQMHLGSRKHRKGVNSRPSSSDGEYVGDESLEGESSSSGILDKILFFIGDLEVASADAKRGRML